MNRNRLHLQISHFTLLSILIVALGLRLWGVSFGLPYRYHPDEPQHVAEAAKMLADKSLEPPVFNNPPFYKYVLMVGDVGFFIFSMLFGHYASTTELISSISQDPSPLYFLGRVISATAGTLTVLVVYFLGKTAYNKRTGILAALFLAVAFLHVRDSHYAVNDALLTLLVTLSLLGSILIVQHGRKRDYILAAVAAGLAFATKYTAIFTVVTLTLAHFLSPGIQFTSLSKLKIKNLIGSGVLVGLAAILGSPYFLLKPGKVYSDVFNSIYSYGAYGFEGWQIDTISGYLFYLKSLWWGLGAGLVILSILGIAVALIRHRREDVLLLSFPLMLYLFMGRQQMYFARFILPVIPAMLVFAALAATSLVDYITSRIRLPESRFSAQPLLILFAAIVILQPAITSIRHNYLLTQKDTRTLTKEWIEANIPAGAKIAVDWPHHSPSLATQLDPEPASARKYDVLVVGGHGISDHNLDYYYTEGFEYLITSSTISNIPLSNKDQADKRQEFYTSLDKELELVYQAQPNKSDREPVFIFDEIYGPAISLWQREQPGPIIKVYSLNLQASK